jgi:hypothetical protein
MIRPLLAISAALIAAVPAGAATYSARPVAPVSQRFIAGDIIWSCGPAACQGATDESRPTVLCQSLSRRVGRLESFIVDGRAFAPADLDRCNAWAPTKPDSALAAK